MILLRQLKALLDCYRCEKYDCSKKHLILPPRSLRFGGSHFKSNADYVEKGARDASNLNNYHQLNSNSKILDFGCGTGRLATGLESCMDNYGTYYGLDVSQKRIRWAKKFLRSSSLEFSWYDAGNERYNPSSYERAPIPFGEGFFTVCFSYSVFSHFEPKDSAFYLREIRRVLQNSGGLLLTAFLDNTNIEYVENPEWFGELNWKGPLHCCLYSFQYFEALCSESGFRISNLVPFNETDGQSLVFLSCQ